MGASSGRDAATTPAVSARRHANPRRSTVRRPGLRERGATSPVLRADLRPETLRLRALVVAGSALSWSSPDSSFALTGNPTGARNLPALPGVDRTVSG